MRNETKHTQGKSDTKQADQILKSETVSRDFRRVESFSSKKVWGTFLARH